MKPQQEIVSALMAEVANGLDLKVVERVAGYCAKAIEQACAKARLEEREIAKAVLSNIGTMGLEYLNACHQKELRARTTCKDSQTSVDEMQVVEGKEQ